MSAFLGPIHYWLYNKILFQNRLTNNIIDKFDKDGAVLKSLEKFGKLSREPLENIIDGANIHGWLQQQVSLVENHLATAVALLCSSNQATMSELQNVAFKFGQSIRPDPVQNAKQWYDCLNDTLLDGMPCDRVNEVLIETDNEVSWRRTHCIHKSYWDEASSDVTNYYKLRDALIDGMIHDSGFVYEKIDEQTFVIKRG